LVYFGFNFEWKAVMLKSVEGLCTSILVLFTFAPHPLDSSEIAKTMITPFRLGQTTYTYFSLLQNNFIWMISLFSLADCSYKKLCTFSATELQAWYDCWQKWKASQ
jgi:hypothetical protein